MNDFALVDNMLSASQTDIGESSNLAQIAQTYSYTFNNSKYDDYVAQLSVIAQAAIDNSKRRFDINIAEEIKRIKDELDLKNNKYPEFWGVIKQNFSKRNINKDLHCPMNYLCNIKFENYRDGSRTLPMSYFFNKYELEDDKRTCKKVEELIQKYSFDLYNYNIQDTDDYILLRSDFDELLRDLGKIKISKNYLGLMSWLIDRAFEITDNVKVNSRKMNSILGKNKSLLIKVLFLINKSGLLSCLSKNK